MTPLIADPISRSHAPAWERDNYLLFSRKPWSVPYYFRNRGLSPIIFIIFVPYYFQLKGWAASTRALAVGGMLSTLLTMFVGATGPFVMAMLRAFSLAPVCLVSTTAACLVIQHSAKVLVFGLLGFAYAPYVPLLVLMVAAGFVGTLIGRRILMAFDPKRFRCLLNIVLTLLAIRLIALGLIS